MSLNRVRTGNDRISLLSDQIKLIRPPENLQLAIVIFDGPMIDVQINFEPYGFGNRSTIQTYLGHTKKNPITSEVKIKLDQVSKRNVFGPFQKHIYTLQSQIHSIWSMVNISQRVIQNKLKFELKSLVKFIFSKTKDLPHFI